jgi:poly-beta-hydroxybutyrate-responsive repressor
LEVLTTGLSGGEEALPVFSHEEEAEMFLWLGELGDGWQARESAAGELTSILCGLCSGAKKVALDPLPKMLDEKTLGLVSLDRERFFDHVLGKGRSSRRHRLTQEVLPPKRDHREDLHNTKKTDPEAHVSKAARKGREDGHRPVDTHNIHTRPSNWRVAVTLLMLRQRNSYGYELMQWAAQFGFGAIDPGTVYRTLMQMEKEGLCESEWYISEDAPARRVYSITTAGASYLDSWAESLGQCERMMSTFFSVYGRGAAADGNESKEDGDGRSRFAPSNLLPERPSRGSGL